jgi:hypothetical protein
VTAKGVRRRKRQFAAPALTLTVGSLIADAHRARQEEA